jgi:cytochrome c peroxidase
MASTSARALITLVLAGGGAACGSGAASPGAPISHDDGGTSPEGGASAAPVFDAVERAKIAELAPSALPAALPDITNHWADDMAAAEFGQTLFFDPGFAGALLEGDNDGSSHTLGKVGEMGKVACAGCHVPAAGFVDNRSLGEQVSLASGWLMRKTPSLLDVGQAKLITWGGRHDALYNQPFGPIESSKEMNSSRLFTAEEVQRRYKSVYEGIFGALPPLDDASRFPALTAATTGCKKGAPGAAPDCHGMPGDHAEYDGMSADDQDAVTRVVVNLGKALGAYERKLSCGAGRFDAWAHGDESKLSQAEQRGLKLFLGKGKCVDCHAGPFFSDQKFHNVGVMPRTVAIVVIDTNDHGAAADLAAAGTDPLNTKGKYSDGDDGRLPASVAPEMEGAFRTPTLRCVNKRPSFFHTGYLRSLDQVVDHFDMGGDPGGFEGTSEIRMLGLSDDEKSDLTSFLQALDGPGPDPSLLKSP